MRLRRLVDTADLAFRVPPRRLLAYAGLAARRRFAAAAPRLTARLWTWPPIPIYRPMSASRTRLLTAAMLEGESLLLHGEEFELNSNAFANTQRLSRLAIFDLHSWEWAWCLETEADGRARASRYWTLWQENNPYPFGDAWNPFVVSQRIWVLLDVFDALFRGSPVEDAVRRHLALSLGYLEHNLELHIHGNHYLKNLKALVAGASVSGSRQRLQEAVACFSRAASEQILPDGGHEERSPAYHLHVLADMLDVRDIADTADLPHDLDELIDRATRWAALMRSPDGAAPALNDSPRVAATIIDALGVPRLPPSERPEVHVLRDSGFTVARNGPWSLVAETGGPGPPEHAGHSHAGTLNFELWYGLQPIFVDTGVSAYSGPRRSYERSTAAHNCLTVDGRDSSSMWGDFRAARLAHCSASANVEDDTITVVAEARLGAGLRGVLHRRTWSLTSVGLRISDDLMGPARPTRLDSFLHWSPSQHVRATSDGATSQFVRLTVRAPSGCAVSTRPPSFETAVSSGFSRLEPAAVTQVSVQSSLPTSIAIEVQRCEPSVSADATEASAELRGAPDPGT